MIPSRETLVEAERRTPFRDPQLEIVIRLRDLLERMAADRSLADSLVLKGGTPLNLCFGVPPLLSVDLDFNYIGAADRAVMLKARPDTSRRLNASADALAIRYSGRPKITPVRSSTSDTDPPWGRRHACRLTSTFCSERPFFLCRVTRCGVPWTKRPSRRRSSAWVSSWLGRC